MLLVLSLELVLIGTFLHPKVTINTWLISTILTLFRLSDKNNFICISYKEIGLIVVAMIIIVIFALMFLNNVISAIRIDIKTAYLLVDDEEIGSEFLKKSWWRDERSAKSWKLFDQLQFISFYVIANVIFPARLVSFTKFFNWANFGTIHSKHECLNCVLILFFWPYNLFLLFSCTFLNSALPLPWFYSTREWSNRKPDNTTSNNFSTKSTLFFDFFFLFCLSFVRNMHHCSMIIV